MSSKRKVFGIVSTEQSKILEESIANMKRLQQIIKRMDYINKKLEEQHDVLFKFMNNTACLYAEGVEFMTRTEIYEQVKIDMKETLTKYLEIKND